MLNTVKFPSRWKLFLDHSGKYFRVFLILFFHAYVITFFHAYVIPDLIGNPTCLPQASWLYSKVDSRFRGNDVTIKKK